MALLDKARFTLVVLRSKEPQLGLGSPHVRRQVTAFYEAGRADANLMLEASNEPVSNGRGEERPVQVSRALARAAGSADSSVGSALCRWAHSLSNSRKTHRRARCFDRV